MISMKRLFPVLLTISTFCFLFPACSVANVSLPAIFGDHMVLQQKAEVTIWGWGKPLEEVAVLTSWDQKTVKTVATNQAKWQVKVQTPSAGGPYSITIKGHNTIELKDVLIGEVWLCSGQSNMEWSARSGIDGADEAVKTAQYPNIRFFSVSHRTADGPQVDLGGEWVVCTPETMQHFSAVAYFFGRRLQQELNVPVGLINSSWGGTPIEVWMNPSVVGGDPVLANSAASLKPVQWGPEKPGRAYHAMIAPIIPYRIAGALWYQGESNTANGTTYAEMLEGLVQSWRKEWGFEFPFYYVQIAPYEYGEPMAGAVVRDEQRQAMRIPKTGMVVVSDIGNIKDIHPRNKLDVGIRLANWALNKTYNKPGIPVSGPLFREMKTEGKKIRLFFDYAENGLFCRGEKLKFFEIAEEDGKFMPAEAVIAGNTIVVRADGVRKPVAVRFAWSNTAEPNLFNKEGLPASCFKAGL